MKIVLEEKDIFAVIKQHVKATNLLGLGDKEFSLQLAVEEDSTISASIDTNIGITEDAEDKPSAPKTRRKRRSKEEIAAAEAATESEADKASNVDLPPFATGNVTSIAEETKADTKDEVKVEETKEEEADVPKAASKSLFA